MEASRGGREDLLKPSAKFTTANDNGTGRVVSLAGIRARGLAA